MNQTCNARCCLGKKSKCPLNINDGYCMAESCQYRVLEIID